MRRLVCWSHPSIGLGGLGLVAVGAITEAGASQAVGVVLVLVGGALAVHDRVQAHRRARRLADAELEVQLARLRAGAGTPPAATLEEETDRPANLTEES